MGVENRGVCVWNVRNKPKTRQQTQHSETKNCGVGVEHRGVCGMFETNPKLGNKIKANEISLESLSFVHCKYCIFKLLDAKIKFFFIFTV